MNKLSIKELKREYDANFVPSQEYLDSAIQRIAQVISGKLVENPEELKIQNQ